MSVSRQIGLAGAAAIVAAAFASPLAAQDSTGSVPHHDTTYTVDRVVAVIGAEPLLQSQLEESFLMALAQQDGPKPATAADSARLRASLLQRLVNEELMVQAAQRDTAIKVTGQDVSDAVDARYKQVRDQFKSEPEFQKELKASGFASVDDYRRWLTDQQRRTLLRQKLIERLRDTKKLKPVNPTEAEIRKAFDDQKGGFGARPPTITFRQLVIAPRASDSARARAFALADSIANALRAGGDFATAARRFSQDPGSKDQGGDLGWTRLGLLDRKFETAALALKPGQISNPVETSFGVHVIQLVRSEPNSLHAKHILIIPVTTQENMDSARALAARVVAAVRAGASFDSLQALYHDQSEEKDAADVPVDQLPDAYKSVLSLDDTSTVVGPFDLTGPDGKVKFDILKVTQRRPAGPPTYQDVRDQLRTSLSENIATQRYLDHLRSATYVDIRPQ